MFAYSREVMCDCYIKALFVHNCNHVKITSLVWSFFQHRFTAAPRVWCKTCNWQWKKKALCFRFELWGSSNTFKSMEAVPFEVLFASV